jgi:glycosyltransferase involved in cell wall biosynthesis
VVIAVDIVTGARPASYSMEIARRLHPEADPVVLASKGYADTPLGILYRMVDHPIRVRQKRRRESVLHADSQVLAYLFAARIAPPRVITVHDLVQFQPEYDDPSYVSRGSPLDALFYRRLAKGLRAADRVVATSDFTRSELLQLGISNERITVVPMGVDLTLFKPRDRTECRSVLAKHGIRTDLKIALYVGTEHPRKNLPGLLRAFARLKTSALLVKVGRPRSPQHEMLLQLARSLGIEGRIKHIESVTQNDLPFLYSSADVLIQPSFTEGFGLPPLEAMACGTPVAVSSAGNLPSLVEDAGLLFDPRDEAEMAAVIDRILVDEDLQGELRSRSRARAGKFPWTATVGGTISAYKAAIASAA